MPFRSPAAPLAAYCIIPWAAMIAMIIIIIASAAALLGQRHQYSFHSGGGRVN
jgi:hypothetical protein